MEEPSSNAMKKEEDVRDCIEESLKFTLESHVNQNLRDFLLPLSFHFCSYLLQPTSDSSVSLDPLYKRLASILYECATSGDLCWTSAKMALSSGEDDSIQMQEWKKLILDEGKELLNIIKRINFELHVQEPFFTQLKDGLKMVEGRCALGDHNRIASGALILINRILVLEVQDVHRYASFSEMLEKETLGKVLPGVKNIDEGVDIYRRFYTEEQERTNGVLAICVAKSVSQPYISLARILSALSYRGLENLLGMSDHPGSTLDAVSASN